MVGRPILDSRAIFKDHSFLGRPKGSLTIRLRYSCNSSSYYGFTVALIYYLYRGTPIGLGFGKTEAARLLSLYFALVIICGVIGPCMADHVFGVRKALHLMNIITPIPYLILTIPGSDIISCMAAAGFLLCNSMITDRFMNTLTAKLYQ